MIRKILEGYRIAEAKEQIPAGTANRAALATVLEAGVIACMKGYYGAPEWAKVESDVTANRQAYEEAGALQEALLSDVTRVNRALKEAHTTTDFPLILGNIRYRVMRDTLQPVTSEIFDMAQRRTVPDFKLIKGYKVGTFNELPLRAEGEDVDLTTLSMTEDGYSVANYEKGIPFTWEAWINDDLGVFTIGLRNLGRAANRTRAKVALRAILAGVAQTTPATAGVGGPSIERLDEMAQLLAERENADGEALELAITDIAFPAKWESLANSTLNSQNVLGPTTAKNPSANPVYGIATPHRERMMASILGTDWLVWDRESPWLEVAVLEGFEGGPKTYTKLPDTVEHVEEGSFDNHSVAVKVGDTVGAKVTETDAVIRVKGS